MQTDKMARADKEGGKMSKTLLVCSSCARAMRGRYKLERVKTTVDFACSMGSGQSHYSGHANVMSCWL